MKSIQWQDPEAIQFLQPLSREYVSYYSTKYSLIYATNHDFTCYKITGVKEGLSAKIEWIPSLINSEERLGAVK